MAKQQSLHRVKMYDPSTYRSVEQKVGDFLRPSGEALVNAGRLMIQTFYGTVALPFRFPTAIRKVFNNQSMIGEVLDSTGEAGGATIGVMAGLVAYGTLGILSYLGVENGDYTIPIIAGGTNLASGIYELGRLKTSRREHLGLQKYKAWQKKKRIEEEIEEEEVKEK